MNIDLMLIGLLVVSTLTSLTTEAVKKLLTGTPDNIIACICSIVISLGTGLMYIAYTDMILDKHAIVLLICLSFLSWLCSMCGYDKVIQTISQIKERK